MSTHESLGRQLAEFRQGSGLTQAELAQRVGVSRAAYSAYETGRNRPRPRVLRALRELGFQAEVGPPKIPASELEIPVVTIGSVAASCRVSWTDPFESEDMEFVPPEMGHVRGRFACRIASDSMYEMLHPDDLCVFHADPTPRINAVILFRSDDGLITVKQLKHDGQDYYLHPLNARYEDSPAKGACLGYLVGVVRWQAGTKTTMYNARGIYPA